MNKIIKTKTFLIGFCLILLSCASSKYAEYYGGEHFLTWEPQLEVQNEAEAQVIVTRLDNKGGYIGIFIDYTFAGKLSNGQTGYYKVPTGGIHEISAKYDQMMYSTDPKLNSRYMSESTKAIEFINNGDQHFFSVRFLGVRSVRGPSIETGFFDTSYEHDVEITQDRSISVTSTGRVSSIPAINETYRTLSRNIPENARIAIVNVVSNNINESIYFIDELTVLFVNAKHFVVDRNRLQAILDEQRFQMSGYVDDNSIISIGHFAEASVVLTGNINVIDGRRRLVFRALDVLTGRILAMSSVDL
jgi:hypothetical protein